MPPQAPEAIDAAFIAAVSEMTATPPSAHEAAPALRGGAAGSHEAPLRAGFRLTGERALSLFDSQLQSRQLDLAARVLRARGTGFHTIGGCGHEGNAAVAAALRVDDPALL